MLTLTAYVSDMYRGYVLPLAVPAKSSLAHLRMSSPNASQPELRSGNRSTSWLTCLMLRNYSRAGATNVDWGCFIEAVPAVEVISPGVS